MSLPGASIPLMQLAMCQDCQRAFSSTESACPKCGSTAGIEPVFSVAATRGIQQLREDNAILKGALITIARGLHTPKQKVSLAERALEAIGANEKRPPASTSDPSKETVQ